MKRKMQKMATTYSRGRGGGGVGEYGRGGGLRINKSLFISSAFLRFCLHSFGFLFLCACFRSSSGGIFRCMEE